MVDFIEFFRLLDFSTWGGRVQMVDFIEFFRLFDLEGGSKWSILLIFFDFSTWGGGKVQMVDFIEFFDFSTF